MTNLKETKYSSLGYEPNKNCIWPYVGQQSLTNVLGTHSNALISPQSDVGTQHGSGNGNSRSCGNTSCGSFNGEQMVNRWRVLEITFKVVGRLVSSFVLVHFVVPCGKLAVGAVFISVEYRIANDMLADLSKLNLRS